MLYKLTIFNRVHTLHIFLQFPQGRVKSQSVELYATLYLKVVGNLGYGCNNSSPRYSVRTTMLSLYPI